MTEPNAIGDSDLHAYVDGELDADARAAVEARLADDPEAAALVAAYRAQKDGLHAAYDRLLDEPVPGTMATLIEAGPERSAGPWPRGVLARIAAALVLLAAGGAGGWGLNDYLRTPDRPVAPAFAQHALGAHALYTNERLHAVEVKAEEAHLVRWLSNRVGYPLKTPSLVEAGYRLVGGRLLPDDSAAAAQFMYEDASGGRLTVYVRAGEGGDTAFHFYRQGDASAFYWVDGPLAYALVGNLEREKLLQLAHLVYDELAK